MNILIVDDDVARSSSLISYLTSYGRIHTSEITTATNINDAKRLLAACYFDVLILDVMLPKRDGETANPNAGIAFLDYLNRTSMLKKPEKIIGLTARINDIGRYRVSFEKHCLTVIEATPTSAAWKKHLLTAIGYMQSSKLARAATRKPIHILTVHGIQTFGNWQTRFEQLVKIRMGGVTFSSYKFGYFTVLAFMFPPLRNREVRMFARHISDLFDSNRDQQFIIFCHSFGTYLVAKALKKLASEERIIPTKLIVLSGSVLPQRFDWNFLLSRGDTKIVNECTDRDYILWLTEAFVLDTGMAGKGGLLGFQNENLVNRFFQGGHSSYFSNDFMIKYWLPLLTLESTTVMIDERQPNTLIHGGIEQIVLLLGNIKIYVYLLFALSLAVTLISSVY
jgi:CheY-like chemotaxis protein